MTTSVGTFCLVLHMHLPYVLGHGRWPHGSDWLAEAALECYLPILKTLRELVGEGISPRMTISISPVLAEQLRAPDFRQEMEIFLTTRLKACQENRKEFAQRGAKELVEMTTFWEKWYSDMAALYGELDGDLLGGFGALMREGHIEIMTCAATHGYLPLLSREESITLQVRQAVETHRRHFGRHPKGIWLPECAYRPRYEWTIPVKRERGRVRYLRKGIEEFMADHGIDYFITDTHMVVGGKVLSAYRDFFPALKAFVRRPRLLEAPDRGWHPYQVYDVASRGGVGQAAVFVRDPKSSLQVWSRDIGYPGDGWYLEFHKKHFPGGNRYWRVTHPKADLGLKEVYAPEQARERIQGHAYHFTSLLAETLRKAHQEHGEAGVICAPYDGELFGHWWFEGPEWLREVYRRLPQAQVQASTCHEYLEKHPPQEVITLLEGSWGEGGDHRVWLNKETEWIWERIYGAEQALVDFLAETPQEVSPLLARLVRQILRETLLLQASDWPFLITTGSARDYAERRFTEHYTNFTRLMESARAIRMSRTLSPEEEEILRRLEETNRIFSDVALHRMKGPWRGPGLPG